MGKSRDDEQHLDPDVEKVVDELLAADKVIERYRERCTAMGREPEFDPPSLVDRLMLVHTTMLGRLGGGGGGLTPDAMMGHLDRLRTGLMDEVKAYVETMLPPRRTSPSAFAGLGIPAAPPTPEELKAINAELEAEGSPDWNTLSHMSPSTADRLLTEFRAGRAPQSAVVSLAEITEGSLGGPILPGEEEVARALGAIPVKFDKAGVHAMFEDVLFGASVDMPAAKRTLELLLTTPEGNDMLQLMVYDAVIIKRKKDAKGGDQKR